MFIVTVLAHVHHISRGSKQILAASGACALQLTHVHARAEGCLVYRV